MDYKDGFENDLFGIYWQRLNGGKKIPFFFPCVRFSYHSGFLPHAYMFGFVCVDLIGRRHAWVCEKVWDVCAICCSAGCVEENLSSPVRLKPSFYGRES